MARTKAVLIVSRYNRVAWFNDHAKVPEYRMEFIVMDCPDHVGDSCWLCHGTMLVSGWQTIGIPDLDGMLLF